VVRFERDKERRIAAHRRVVLRKESQIVEHSRRLKEIQTRVAQETATATQTAQDLSNLRRARYSTHLIIHLTYRHTKGFFLFICVLVECYVRLQSQVAVCFQSLILLNIVDKGGCNCSCDANGDHIWTLLLGPQFLSRIVFQHFGYDMI